MWCFDTSIIFLKTYFGRCKYTQIDNKKKKKEVLINKHIFVNFGFPNITLTFIHFLVTFIGLIICLQFDIFRFKRLPIVKMIPLSMTYCGFVVFTNLSLQYNTVGTYQVIKVLTAPCVMVISYIFYQKKYSLKVQLTLVSN